MKRNFKTWISGFRDNIADWVYYTDFPKVYFNANKIKVELNILNSLINSKNIESDFKDLLIKYPEVLKAIPILLAKRDSEVKIVSKGKDKCFNFSKLNYSIDDYITFMNNTGLFDLLSNHLISDLNDYVKGVEVGLDTNARKNRTGKAMENIVEEFIIEAGYKRNINYYKEMKTSEIKEKFGVELNLNAVNESKAEKKFDFVIYQNGIVYGIEVNFYSGGGSKLNETARSYKLLAQESMNISGFEFVWITDGIGWHTAKRNLEETFDVLEHLYNLRDLENNKLNDLLNK